MANKREYITRLQVAIQELHKCGAVHRETVPVLETFRGQTVWQGEVETFDLNGHPKASRCYAWSHREGENNEGERFVTVLAIPPINSPLAAVRASIVSDSQPKVL